MSLILPPGRHVGERELLQVFDFPRRAKVTLCRVYMGRQGWRYEVNAERETREAVERDTLWLELHADAVRLARLAGDELYAARRPDLSALARRHAIPLPLR
jgi:hypothetical protein